MKPKSYSSEGIVLARRNYGEADRILSVYSRSYGRISLLAKGVRKPTSRKRGHIEVFSKLNFQGVSGSGIDLITEAELIDDFGEIRKSLKKISLAYFFCEVVGKITHEHEKNEELYGLLLTSLITLKKRNTHKSFRMEFIQKVLEILGFWPRGVPVYNLDEKLEEIVERQMNTKRVGKRMLQ